MRWENSRFAAIVDAWANKFWNLFPWFSLYWNFLQLKKSRKCWRKCNIAIKKKNTLFVEFSIPVSTKHRRRFASIQFFHFLFSSCVPRSWRSHSGVVWRKLAVNILKLVKGRKTWDKTKKKKVKIFSPESFWCLRRFARQKKIWKINKREIWENIFLWDVWGFPSLHVKIAEMNFNGNLWFFFFTSACTFSFCNISFFLTSVSCNHTHERAAAAYNANIVLIEGVQIFTNRKFTGSAAERSRRRKVQVRWNMKSTPQWYTLENWEKFTVPHTALPELIHYPWR